MQGLRPSQFITTFGPGALIETPNGPYVLGCTEDVLKQIHACHIPMDALEIRDIRLQRGLLKKDRIFRIPDNQSWNQFLYPAKHFPTWNLCVEHANFNVIHKGKDGCPECTNEAKRRESRKSKHAIRFLVACPKGHLDDVNWKFLIHARQNNPSQNIQCPSEYFLWIGSGSSLSSIKLRCPRCNAEKFLGEVYSSKLRCRGRRPERDQGDPENCDTEQAIVVQRGSFQLRLPESVTSLAIPELIWPIYRILELDVVQQCIDNLKELNLFNEENFWRLLNRNANELRISKEVVNELQNNKWAEIQEALADIESIASPKQSRAEYLEQEHKSLMDVAETGFPPYPSDNERRPGEPIAFQVDAGSIRKSVSSPNKKLFFRVVPIERLKVVIVQTGYRRVEYVGPKSVLTSSRGSHPTNSAQYWVPGVEQFGEGIFVDLDPSVNNQSNWYPQGTSSVEWDSKFTEDLKPTDLIRWNALSVWWHTFSHRLINAMSLHSGYSSTAIRERIYFSKLPDGSSKGGALLYTTQPGGDGTMGGLTSLVPGFESILELALNNIDRCSNDPLCENAEVDPISHLGAACYSCAMVSETSCEHFNSHLTRRILLENLP